MDYKKKMKLRKNLKDAGRLDLFYKCVYYDTGLDEDGDPVEVNVEDLKNILIKLNPEKKIYTDNKDYDYSDI
tara:strand:- start:1735 stop:1950 length:216 start_codon:yes stop_codon:yes gene_type:complete